jgi:hypothetical protein
MRITLHRIIEKYVYKSEFMNDNDNDKKVDIDNFNPDYHMKTEIPLIYHVYNDTKVQSLQNYIPFSIKYIIYLL